MILLILKSAYPAVIMGYLHWDFLKDYAVSEEIEPGLPTCKAYARPF